MTTSGWFQIEKVGYQGQILPILMAAYVMSVIEKWLRARVPNAIQLLVVPITTIVVTGVLAKKGAARVKEIIETLERATDKAEDVANALETITVKNA